MKPSSWQRLYQHLERKSRVMHKKRTLPIFGVLLSLLLVAACSPTVPASTATLDLNPLRTEVASTVLAEVTQALALTPSITPSLSPTDTIQPTSTPRLSASPSPGANGTLSSGTPVGTVNHAQWVSQSIADDTVFNPGETFTMIWHLKNTGTSTWTAKYVLRFYSGATFGAPKEIAIGRDVLPGDEIEISVPMKAPTNSGNFISTWVMANENLSNFKDPVFLKIKVAAPVTPTPSPKP
jgi:hypothetical protein